MQTNLLCDKAIIYLIAWFVIVNVLTFVLYGIDKYYSQKKYWRISENRLLFMAIIGGSVGALLAMRLFHHKTKHLKFYIGIPLILLIQIIVVAAIMYI